MDIFSEAIAEVLPIEGGYTDDPNDSGGETNFGITYATARAAGYVGSMQDMTQQDATNIYRAKFWLAMRLDEVGALSPPLARFLFIESVNLGNEQATKLLQRVLNVFNKRGILYPDVLVDGDLGNATLSALRAHIQARGVQVLLKAINSMLGAFYIELAEQRQKDEEFVYGWISQRVKYDLNA